MSHALRQNGTGDQLAEEAAGWFLKLNDPACNEAERRSFDAWLAADASHRDEYRQFERLWKALDSLPKQRSRRMSQAKLAGFALIGMLVLLFRFAPPTEQQLIVTGIGERRYLVLTDGTELSINAASRLRTHYTWFSRTIEVESGEARFTVAPDRLRQFEVRAGNGRMRDIGTTFNVANEGGKVTVGVIEGKVEVRLDGHNTGTVLEGGKQITYSETCVAMPTSLDAEAATARRGGRWTCKNATLDEIVTHMNRQHHQQTTLDDPELSSLLVSGVFNISDRAGLLKALQVLYHLQAREEGETTRLIRVAGQ